MKKCIVALVLVAFSTAVCFADEPDVEASGSILTEAGTGRVLWGKNEHEPLAMASTTKIMTAILAIESGRADEIVTVSKRAAAAPKVKMYLSPGENVRLGDLMLALMLESSNDAAVAIAEHLGGSVEDFCAAMTEKAREIGAVNTIFETPNGLDAGEHHSTAYDLAQITRYALEVPGFIELTNTPNAFFHSDRRSYSFHNRNRLLHEFSGANGVKTGFTNKAGHCFVGAAKRDDMQLISVVLASGWGERGKSRKWTDTKNVLNFGFDNFEFVTVVESDTFAVNTAVTRSRTPSMDFVYKETVRVPLARDERDDVYVEAYIPVAIPAPIAAGEIIGCARVFIGTDFYCELPIAATADAARHDLKTSLEKVLNAYFGLATDRDVNVILPEF
ncbi:MAG: D-alanyl-D-alanine carboxypeptidase [Defluviitaleaceae bacterium]|nr:D-alanyl-D-alanine carboxypeptidase [Defluviitaleaceae bacterium]